MNVLSGFFFILYETNNLVFFFVFIHNYLYILEQKKNKTINQLYFSKFLALNMGIFFSFCFSFLHIFPLFFPTLNEKTDSRPLLKKGEKWTLSIFTFTHEYQKTCQQINIKLALIRLLMHRLLTPYQSFL